MIRRFWIAVVLLTVSVAKVHGGTPGSADFHATPEHPFGFRGDGGGCFPGATPVLNWSEKEKKNVRWSATVGMSFSSPVLTEKFVFVTSEPNVLLCVNRADGAVRWKVEIKPDELTDEKARKTASEYEPPKDGSGMMAATPITDGKFVYVVLANGIVRAFDLDGKPQWIAYIDAEQITGYGRSSSPILAGGKLIVHMSNLYAFDPANGKQLWMNADTPSTYGSPAGFKSGADDMIVTPNGDVVRAADGKVVATEVAKASHTSPLPAADGTIYFGENTVVASRMNPASKKWEDVWTGSLMGEVFATPLLHEGILFTVTGKGELIAFDTKGKGDQNPIFEPRALFGETEANSPVAYASLALGGKYLFLNSNRGDVVILEATREAKQIAKVTMSAGGGGSIIFSGKEMFVRAGAKLVCVGE